MSEQAIPCKMLPTDLAALAAGVTPATIRKWASRDRLTRLGSPKRALYYLCELMSIAAGGKGSAHHPDTCSCSAPGTVVSL